MSLQSNEQQQKPVSLVRKLLFLAFIGGVVFVLVDYFRDCENSLVWKKIKCKPPPSSPSSTNDTSNTSDTSKTSSSSSKTVWIIIGSIIGAAILLLVIGILLYKRRQKNNDVVDEDDAFYPAEGPQDTGYFDLSFLPTTKKSQEKKEKKEREFKEFLSFLEKTLKRNKIQIRQWPNEGFQNLARKIGTISVETIKKDGRFLMKLDEDLRGLPFVDADAASKYIIQKFREYIVQNPQHPLKDDFSGFFMAYGVDPNSTKKLLFGEDKKDIKTIAKG